MTPKELVNILYQSGFSPFVGVPCSLLSGIITDLESRNDYISATSEGEVIGIMSGAALAGKIPVALMQNSGLGNAVNPITSLVNVFNFKGLLVIGYRGYPHGTDEIQHHFMGSITEKLLDLLGIKSFLLTTENTEFELSSAIEYIKTNNKIAAVLIPKGALEKEKGIAYNSKYVLSVEDSVEEIVRVIKPDDTVISTTGTISRILFDKNHRPKNFYMFGSMGCACSIGLGYSLSSDSRAVVIDGDGAVLMKMGSLSTNNRFGKKMIHIVLDNECYSSTGGQATNSAFVDFEKIASGCGYENIFRITAATEFLKLEQALEMDTAFIVIKTNNNKPSELPRIKLEDIKLNKFIKEV
jgi:phosphonopyruvate decarboxylase